MLRTQTFSLRVVRRYSLLDCEVHSIIVRLLVFLQVLCNDINFSDSYCTTVMVRQFMYRSDYCATFTVKPVVFVWPLFRKFCDLGDFTEKNG